MIKESSKVRGPSNNVSLNYMRWLYRELRTASPKKSSVLVDIKANDFKDNHNLPLIEIAEESRFPKGRRFHFISEYIP